MVWDSRPPQPRGGRGRARQGTGVRYAAMAHDERFLLLRSRFRRLAAAIVASFMGWYLLYVLLSAFARGFMAQPLFGNVNVALVMGVLQFVSTFSLAWCYASYARKTLDPLSAELRAEADQAPHPPGHAAVRPEPEARARAEDAAAERSPRPADPFTAHERGASVERPRDTERGWPGVRPDPGWLQ